MTTNELITEIEDALKRERMEKAAREYGPFILGGILIAIVLTGLFTGWQSWQKRQNGIYTAELLAASESANPADRMATTAEELGASQALVAYLGAAGLHLQKGEKEQAIAQFQKAYAEKSGPGVLRDMALLQSVRLQWDVTPQESSEATANDLMKKIAPLVNNDSSPWQSHALLQAAMMAAHGLNDYDMALSYLDRMNADAADADLLPPLRQRAMALKHLYGLKRPQDEEAAVTPADAAANPDTQG